MLLAIDVGNTKIAFGFFEEGKLLTTLSAATSIRRLADDYAALIFNLLPRHNVSPDQISEAVICSVVPPLIPVFDEMCRHYLNCTPLVIEAGVKTGVRVRLDNPKEVGGDRIVNAAAAYKLYGGPAIVLDFGTALTFDIVSAQGDYTGGAIAPGMEIAAESLFMRAAKLPRVELVAPKHAIAKNSVTAMQSGIVFGYVALVEGMLNRLQQELSEKAQVIATGGYAEVIAKQTKMIDIVDSHLTLIGLQLIHELNKGDGKHAYR